MGWESPFKITERAVGLASDLAGALESN